MSSSGVCIRKACIDDLDGVKALADANKSSLGFVLRPSLADGIQRGWMLVAEWADQIIGFVHYRHRQDTQTTLYEICVDENWRGKGTGRLLIRNLISESTILGKKSIRLKAPIDIQANLFYRQLDFVLLETVMGKQRGLNVWELHLDRGKS